MGHRTFEEIQEDTRRASTINDAEALLRYASELDALDTPQAVAWACSARGWALHLHGDYPAAHENYRRALAYYEATGDHNSVAGTTCNIGNLYMSTGDYPDALEHFHRALALCEELGNQRFAANIMGGIGSVHYRTGDYPAALAHYHRALALHEELGNHSGIAMTTGNIGLVLVSTGDHRAALEHYHRALALHEEHGDRSGVAGTTSNIGGVYLGTGDHQAALDHYLRALTLHEELGDRSGVARATGNVLALRVAMGSDADAQKLLLVMDSLHIDEPELRIGRELQRATLQVRDGDVDGAVLTLQNALSESQQFGLRPQAADIHKELRELALKRNDLAAYVEHNNEFTRITEEINGRDTATKLAMQAKQREIDAVQREHQKHLAVLHSTLPKEVAERVARGEVVNDHFDNATVIFLDIVGFTELSSSMSSQEVIELLDDVFTQCDAICAQHGVTKIKTIGDSYMAVSFDNVIKAALCAVEMSRIRLSHEVSHNVSHAVSHNVSHNVSHSVSHAEGVLFRIGMHCGPVTAGVIGKERMQYDVWGDTVNVASRMESAGEPGKVHVSEALASELKRNTEYIIQNAINESRNQGSHEVSHSVSHNVSHSVSHNVSHSVSHSVSHEVSTSLVTIERGSIDIKGKGPMQTYWLESST